MQALVALKEEKKMQKQNVILITVGLIALVGIASFLASENFRVPAEPPSVSAKPFFVGIEIGWNTDVSDCKALIDKVKNYTNLLVIASPKIMSNRTMLNDVCDYARDSGLNFMVYFDNLEFASFYPGISEQYKPMDWLKEAKEQYGDRFLGVYYDDEMGGKQLDMPYTFYLSNSPSNYQESANRFVHTNQENLKDMKTTLNSIPGTEISAFTSDYALYWFDYKRGYDVVLTQFGWNNSRPLQIALTRGAAKAQNKDWGAIITWTYDQPPYLESAPQLYDDMVLAYDSGAKYVAIYDASDGYQNSTFTDEHFEALKNFWNYVQQNPDRHGRLTADTALVLPRDYGCGFRYLDDSIWGFKKPNEWTRRIYNDVYGLLNEYGLTLDIVYNDPEIGNSPEGNYAKVIRWTSGAENDKNYPVLNLNNSLGYATIQEAINSYATYDGDGVFVKAGIYRENVVVNRSIALVGENRDTTLIDGGRLDTALNIVSNNVTVTGFTVQNGRNLTSGIAAGILLDNANDSRIIGNTVKACDVGILLQSSSNNTPRNNVIADNDYNFGVSGSTLSHYLNDVDSSNTVDGKPIHYLINKNNEVVPSDAGYVALVNCSNITVQDLHLSSNYNGLLLAFTSQSSITNNVITGNYEGIKIDSAKNNVLKNNNMNSNDYNFFVQNALANDIDASNKVDDKPVCYWVDQHNKTVPVNSGYVALIDCTDIIVEKLQLANNGQGILLVKTRNSTLSQNTLANHFVGILLDRSSNITIAENDVTANQNGISLKASSNNAIAENNVTANVNSAIALDSSNDNALNGNRLTNNDEGIFINASSNNSIRRNLISENGFGIRFQRNTVSNSSYNSITENTIEFNQRGVEVEYGTANNTLYHNNFVNNPSQVTGFGITNNNHSFGFVGRPMPGNSWDNGSSEGNYWSDYTGIDADHNRIGDAPYVLNYVNQDNYPLMQPYA